MRSQNSPNAAAKIEVEMRSDSIGPDWLIGEPTRLLDRFVPIVEEARLPAVESVTGKLSLDLENSLSIAQQTTGGGWKKKLKALFSSKPVPVSAPEDLVCLDLRLRHPGNWAHAFTNHFPLALLITKELGLASEQVCVLLPKSVSKKISNLFEKASFAVMREDGPVSGRFCHFDLAPWISLRGCRSDVLRDALADTPLRSEIAEKAQPERKIFISRKDQRKLSNEAEVESYLSSLGYEKIYPEDFDLIDQIALICGADDIIAVHGAGLGPLILKAAMSERPYQLLEIFSPAHITNVYRMIAHQTGGSWVGVRGNVWPELLGGEENFVGNMKDFSVSLEALKRAMEIQKPQAS